MKVAFLAFAEFSSVAWGSRPWPTLFDYGHAVSAYWWAILAGAAVLSVDVLKWRGRESKVPMWLKIALAISAFSLAQFLAYRDSMLDIQRVRYERRDAVGERDELKLEVGHERAKLEEKDNLIQSQQNLINEKIVSSLESQRGVPCLGPRIEMPCHAGNQSAVTANRLLDDKRKNILVALLQSTPAVVEIQEPVNNEEAARRGSELLEILGKAGWSFRRIKWVIPETEVPTGIVIRSGANNLPMVAQLEKALSDVGGRRSRLTPAIGSKSMSAQKETEMRATSFRLISDNMRVNCRVRGEPMHIAAPLLLFLMVGGLYAQTNCPTPDHNAPIPLALLSSPLIRMRPRLPQSVLTLPADVQVDVKATLKPLSVELWTGPTGTEVAEFYCRLALDDHPVATGKYMRFSFVLTSCKQVGMRLEPRVFVRDKAQPMSVYEGPFECRERISK